MYLLKIILFCACFNFISMETRIDVKEFGDFPEDPKHPKVYEIIMANRILNVSLITYGATIKNIFVPDGKGIIRDVILGYDTLEGYRQENNPYMGATVGRVANRLNKGQFTLDGNTYKVGSQSEDFSLHGGIKGFDKMNWDYFISNNSVIFTYLSKDNEEGYPGNLLVTVTYTLRENKFCWKYTAQTTKKTIINLTNHAYFNLAGYHKGAEALYKHTVEVNAGSMTETDHNSIPTGKIIDTYGTSYDLKMKRTLGEVLKANPQGIDNNFIIDGYVTDDEPVSQNEILHGLTFVAKLDDPEYGITMNVYSNCEGVQVYTSNHFPAKGDEYTKPIIGKNNTIFQKHAAVCFETQNYPDAINHPKFPSPILSPGETYSKSTVLAFYSTSLNKRFY